MTIAITPQHPTQIQPADEYPSSDGNPMAETEVHILAMLHLLQALRYFFRNQPEVFVIANMLLYYQKGDPQKKKAPDIMVVKGVDTTIKRRSYKLWEEQIAPQVVIEITSKGTIAEDIVTKPVLYAALGIKEYFLFDPLFEYLDQQLLGYRMINGDFELITPDSDGDLHSEELGLILSVEQDLLRIVDPATGEFVPAMSEAMLMAERERQRAEQEAQRAEQEAQRANAAEAELEQLRAILKGR